MKINLNKNQKNKQINWTNLRIQLSNYNGINPRSSALHEIQNKNREKNRERKETKLGPPKGSKTPKSPACFSAFPLVSLYRLLLDFGLYLSVAKII